MRNRLLVLAFASLTFAFAALPASAQEAQPGDACTTAEEFIRVGGPENPGSGHFMLCDGATWQPVLNYSSADRRVMFGSAGLAAAPLHVWGEAIIGNQGLACASAAEGAIRYLSSGASPPWEYCDGSAWSPFKQPRCEDDDAGECYLDATRDNDDPEFLPASIKDGVVILGVTGTYTSGACTGPASCPNVGDVCADGSLFAGVVLDGASCDALFVTDDNQSTGAQWKNAADAFEIDPDDDRVGQVNHDNRSGNLSDFPAFELCESNSYHGKADWYLPAREELNLLWLNRAAIDANAAGNFTTSQYWASTESDIIGRAWYQIFSDGVTNQHNKTNNFNVRCVRREPASGGGGGGCTAPSLCPNIGDVCDDSNAGTTNDPIFAGFMLYQDPTSADVGECKPLFVTDNNQSTSSDWKTSTGTDDITTDSTEDGKINDGQVANSTTFPAFKLCKDLSDGGFSDWYLPARDELHLLWKNKSAIDANAAGNFTIGHYWSSTEDSTSNAWYQNFGGGYQNGATKTLDSDVRCVRRD